MNRIILDNASKQQKNLSCRPHKILSASKCCSRVPPLSDSLVSGGGGETAGGVRGGGETDGGVSGNGGGGEAGGG